MAIQRLIKKSGRLVRHLPDLVKKNDKIVGYGLTRVGMVIY
jgi:hypothetical protein